MSKRAGVCGLLLCEFCLLLIGLASTPLRCAAADPADRSLLDFSKPGVEKRIVPEAPDQVSFARAPDGKGLDVTFRPGKAAYPGIELKPEGAVWDLSSFGHVEARITNTGTARIAVSLRVDNAGDWQTNPWNGETVRLKPGETGTVRVQFGFSWGKPGFALNPAKVSQLLIYGAHPKEVQTFRIEAITAGGAPGEKPPVNPDSIRTKPKDGILLGKDSSLDAAKQLVCQHGAKADVANANGGQVLNVVLPAGNDNASAQIKPAVGRWDLRDWYQVVVRARNTGQTPVTLKARIEGSPRPLEWVSAAAPMAPGAEGEVTLPFFAGVATWDASDKMIAGAQVDSDRVSGIAVTATGDGERYIQVDSVRAVTPPAPSLPNWLGKRPPVPGDWKQTFDEEFNGTTIDSSKWAIYHPNYWDKRCHFSKDNVLLGDGVVKLRFEKKRGHADDDPKKPETDWATGFLTTLDKWTQRYGYFECRMKLPTAPGLWPAFWMMPDRGAQAGAKRQDTHNGGMEFDILEYLTRFGPYRYNIACHWDGYGKDHKSLGCDRIYVQPDKDGFITAGLLWEPGKATFYANGSPVMMWTSPRICSGPEHFLFTAVSGGWGGNDLTGQGLPDDYVIDYVRVWQRADWNEPASPQPAGK